jgi:outer membrane protein insertion porin family
LTIARPVTDYRAIRYRPHPDAASEFPAVDRALRTAAVRASAQSGVEYEPVFIRAQGPNPYTPADPFAPPQNPLYEWSPQGDPLDPTLRQPRQGEVDLIYELTEAQTGRLMFGVGVNSSSGLVGSIVLSEQNFDLYRPPRSFQDFIDGTAFRGGGQRFRLEAIPGSQVSRYLASWTDPYFLNTNYSLSLSGFYYQRFFNDWTEERAGGRISVGYPITPQWAVTTALRLEDVEISNPDLNPLTGGPRILADAVGQNFLSTGRVSVVHDTRDAAFLPGSGHRVELSFEQAFGNYHYPRAEVEGQQFFTLHERPDGGGRHLLTLSGQLGWTGNDTPIFERFFAGGFQTFRGFDFRGVGPKEDGVRIGGTFLALSTVEYMFPILANDMVHGVVFSDMGTVQNDVSFDQFRITVGAGLRLTVPALGPVPLAFDWAVPVRQEDTDDRRIFSFYIGMNR